MIGIKKELEKAIANIPIPEEAVTLCKQFVERQANQLSRIYDEIHICDMEIQEKNEEIYFMRKDVAKLIKQTESSVRKLALFAFLGADSSVVTQIIYGPDELTMPLFPGEE